MDRDYSSSLSGAVEALEASTLRLPGGARADIQNVMDAIGSAVFVMQAMVSSLCLILSKVNKTGFFKLRLALASATAAELQVRVNDPKADLPLFSSGVIGKDISIARHGIHGLYWLYTVNVPGRNMRHFLIDHLLLLPSSSSSSRRFLFALKGKQFTKDSQYFSFKFHLHLSTFHLFWIIQLFTRLPMAGQYSVTQFQQVARFLMKTVAQLGSGKKPVGTSYMGRIEHLMQCRCDVERGIGNCYNVSMYMPSTSAVDRVACSFIKSWLSSLRTWCLNIRVDRVHHSDVYANRDLLSAQLVQ
ncbi:Rhamnogalacturonate lyase family protein [Thalictrum thalictroides]|uniref:Rhamnogalacturonate lyase family protein n=1 Tax=Thalictrum thalictroides TaxID=46969 RepID=A0A7J6WSE7_THATH|nr:Rhamnogalacturonate lyase family protein [Thalictrum thalictroides]